MVSRYIDIDSVKIQSSTPKFGGDGYCVWCGEQLTGKAVYYCSLKKFTSIDLEKYRYYGQSPCAIYYSKYFYSRPAYVRATFIRDDFTCKYCRLKPMRADKPWLPDLSQLHCDHRVPISKNGEAVMENLQTLCSSCNLRKGTKSDKRARGIILGKKTQLKMELI